MTWQADEEVSSFVTPAKAGVHKSFKSLDSGFRRDDRNVNNGCLVQPAEAE